MQMIDTAYRPDGPLGALFSGYNSAAAEQDQKQNLIREFLANQREQQAQPFDQMGKEYEGMLAQAKTNSPDYIPWALKGQIGQMMSQDAAGRGKQEEYAGDVAVHKQANENTLSQGRLMETLLKLKELGTTGTSGFNMQPQLTGTAPGNGFFGNKNDIAQQLQQLPDSPDKQAALAQFSQQVQEQQPQVAQNDRYEQVMKNIMDTPEQRQKLELLGSKNAAAQLNRETQMATLLEIAKLKGQGKEKEAKTAQEGLVRDILHRTDLSDQEKRTELGLLQASLAKLEGGFVLEPNAQGQIAPVAKSHTPPYVPTGQKGLKTKEDYDAAWKALAPGESMLGPDGTKHTK